MRAAVADSATSFALVLGIIRAGYVAFPISTRNSVPAVAHLLAKSGTDHLVVGPEAPYQNLARDALRALERDGGRVPHTSTMPVYEDLYGEGLERELLPDYKADMRDVALYLHSSGTELLLWCGVSGGVERRAVVLQARPPSRSSYPGRSTTKSCTACTPVSTSSYPPRPHT